MKEIDVDPNKIGKWIEICYEGRSKINCYYDGYSEPLIDVVNREGWEGIPRVPIFKLPEGFPHEFLLVDGHYRHETALRLNCRLPCNLYDLKENIDFVKDKLAKCFWIEKGSAKESYPYLLKLYKRLINFEEVMKS